MGTHSREPLGYNKTTCSKIQEILTKRKWTWTLLTTFHNILPPFSIYEI